MKPNQTNNNIQVNSPAGIAALYDLLRKTENGLVMLPDFHHAMVIQANSHESYSWYHPNLKSPMAAAGVHHQDGGSTLWLLVDPEIGNALLHLLRSPLLRQQLKKSKQNSIQCLIAVDNSSGQRMAKLAGFQKHEGVVLEFGFGTSIMKKTDFDLWEYK